MTQNSLTLYSKDELAILADLDLGIAGLENLEAGDIGMPPRLRISQPNRPITIGSDEARPGAIVNTLTGEQWDSLDMIVIVYLPHTRVMWPEQFSADSEPLCVSDDGGHPSRGSDMLAGPCKVCPMAQFVEGKKPRCADQRNFLVYLPEIGEAAILTLQSTAIKEARQLTALTQGQGIKKTVTMSALKIKDDRGTWFVPRFSRGRALTIAEIMEVAEVRNEMKNLTIRADSEQVEPRGDVNEPVIIEDAVPF
jgi:hypothetical protein